MAETAATRLSQNGGVHCLSGRHYQTMHHELHAG
jgi:hypothetical protein